MQEGLHVDTQEEEHGKETNSYQERADIGPAAVAFGQDSKRQEGMSSLCFNGKEGKKEYSSNDEV